MAIESKDNVRKVFIDSLNRHIERRRKVPYELLGCPLYYDIAVDFGIMPHNQERLDHLMEQAAKDYPAAKAHERLEYCKHAIYNDFISECCDFDILYDPEGQAVPVATPETSDF